MPAIDICVLISWSLRDVLQEAFDKLCVSRIIAVLDPIRSTPCSEASVVEETRSPCQTSVASCADSHGPH